MEVVIQPSAAAATEFAAWLIAEVLHEKLLPVLGLATGRIVHATFMRKDQPGATRCQGYEKAMRHAGLKPEFLHYPLSEEQRPIVRQSVQDFVREHGCPEAFFCHSDDVALGIYRGLRDLNLRVPQDVALVGCDGIQDTEHLECPLTTLVQPVAEMCATAWQFLLQRLEHPGMKRQTAVLKPKLTIRESSRGSTLTVLPKPDGEIQIVANSSTSAS